MSLNKKFIVEFTGFYILIIALIGTGWLSFSLLQSIYNSSICTVFFVVISVILSLVYYYIVHRLDNKVI